MNRMPKRADSQLWNDIFYGSDEQRIEFITRKVMKAWRHFCPEIVGIEGYSFGSKGSALSALHELGGVMKNKLHRKRAVYVIVTPGEVKSFATDNGNASKDDMVLAAQDFWPDCPSHDEADALHIARYVHKNYAKLVEPVR